MRIVVGSTNPAKIEAVRLGFQGVFPSESLEIEGTSVHSGVSDQPFDDTETIQGAYNRAREAQNVLKDVDYTVGLEGGIRNEGDAMAAFAWVVVLSKDGTQGKGKTGTFFLPFEVAALIRSGVELGEANDQFFQVHNSKHGGGAVGILTKGALARAEYYAQAVTLALIPHINKTMEF